MYIAEQQLVATAVGLQVRNWVPFASTFAAFFSRAYDFIRMAAISQANISLCGSHAGVSIGEDGPSQMALEDLGDDARRPRLDRALPLRREPDREARRRDGRPRRDRLHALDARERRRSSTARTRSSRSAARAWCARATTSTIVGAGITLHESLKAAEQLAGEGIEARVIDLYSVKPADGDTLRAAAEATGGRVLTVEDHWPEGGIGDAVLEALSADGELPARVVRLAVREMPGSGKPSRAARRGRDRRRAHRRGRAGARRRPVATR